MAFVPCDAAKAFFMLAPSQFPICGDDAEDTLGNRLDQLVTALQDTVSFGSGGIARFFRINPCFDLMDEHYEIIVYRDEFVKKNPQIFGMKAEDVAKLDSPTPESFAVAMNTLMHELTYFCDFEDDVTLDISNATEDGKFYPISHMSGCRINPEEYECDGDDDYEYDDEINKEEDDEL